MKTIFITLIKLLSGTIVLILLFFGVLFILTSGTHGYKVSFGSVKYYYKKNGHEQWFFNKKTVEQADAATFEAFTKHVHYGKDKNRVYYQGEPLPGSDPATFSIVELLGVKTLCRDQQNVYYQNSLVSNDANNFERIGNGFYKDRQFIYSLNTEKKYPYRSSFVKIDGAHPQTFKIEQ